MHSLLKIELPAGWQQEGGSFVHWVVNFDSFLNKVNISTKLIGVSKCEKRRMAVYISFSVVAW